MHAQKQGDKLNLHWSLYFRHKISRESRFNSLWPVFTFCFRNLLKTKKFQRFHFQLLFLIRLLFVLEDGCSATNIQLLAKTILFCETVLNCKPRKGRIGEWTTGQWLRFHAKMQAFTFEENKCIIRKSW